MANDTLITVVGNLTADPELHFTQAGIAVANFVIASTPRFYDKQANEWRDAEAMFLRSAIWRDAAENVTESLEKGDRVIAQGHLVQRNFTDREGNKRTSFELDVLEIGPSLRYATAKPRKIDRRQQGGFGAGQGGDATQGGTPPNEPGYGGGAGYDDPPF